MTKQEYINILKLLSALEGWSYSVGTRPPKQLLEDLTAAVQVLEQEILK